jgi:cytochrome bd ubiquinol oxidase subunit I
VLPTAMSVSALSMTEVALTLAGFVIFYTVLFIIEMGLMLKYIRKGPFQDVAETEAWNTRHNDRLAGRRNADAIAQPDLHPAE